MIVDGQKVLVSIDDDSVGAGGDTRPETAIWGEGGQNSLVVVVKAIFEGLPNPSRPE